MSQVPYAVRLSGRGGYGREAPPVPVGQILAQTGPAVRQAILMGFVGRSSPPGRPPRWLDRAADVRFVGIDGDEQGATILRFEAPRLGEAAEELYRQQEFWSSNPDGDDTGFDLLGDVLGDVAEHREDSGRFDTALLRRIGHFGKVFGRGFDRATLTGHRFGADSPAVLDGATVENARRLDSETPMPQQVRVAGTLDMIRMSSASFELILDDKTRARGVLVAGDGADVPPLAGGRVLVQGVAVYRPSGRLLRIDARRVEPGADAAGFWSKIPPPRRRKFDPRTLRKPQGPTNGVSAFFGTWPGNESDEEWGEIVESLS